MVTYTASIKGKVKPFYILQELAADTDGPVEFCLRSV